MLVVFTMILRMELELSVRMDEAVTQSDLSARIRAQALHLTLDLGFRRPPPAETAFIHRKLAGTFLLCARLRARFDVAKLAEPYLEVATN